MLSSENKSSKGLMGMVLGRDGITAERMTLPMLAGLAFTLLYIFTYLGWFFIPGTNMLANSPDNWLFGISPLAKPMTR
mgnify:CR=1 FL=1